MQCKTLCTLFKQVKIYSAAAAMSRIHKAIISSILALLFVVSNGNNTKECAQQYMQQLTNIFGIKYIKFFENLMLPSLEVIKSSTVSGYGLKYER